MRKLRVVKRLTVAELVKDLQGFDQTLTVRFCAKPLTEHLIISIYGVTKKEAKFTGRSTEAVGVWIDLEGDDAT